MAGEWNHIIPTHPSDTSYRARQTRQILYVDPNGIQHSIKAVYWSPTSNSNDVKLIWLRDSTVLKVLVAGDTSVAIQYKTSVYSPLNQLLLEQQKSKFFTRVGFALQLLMVM